MGSSAVAQIFEVELNRKLTWRIVCYFIHVQRVGRLAMRGEFCQTRFHAFIANVIENISLSFKGGAKTSHELARKTLDSVELAPEVQPTVSYP